MQPQNLGFEQANSNLRQTNQFVSCLVYYPRTSKFNDQQKTENQILSSHCGKQFEHSIWRHQIASGCHVNSLALAGTRQVWLALAGWTTLIFFMLKQTVMISVFLRIVVLVWTMLTGALSEQPLLVVFVNLNEWNFNWFRNLGYVDEFAVKDRQQFSAKDSDLSRFNIRTTKYYRA